MERQDLWVLLLKSAKVTKILEEESNPIKKLKESAIISLNADRRLSDYSINFDPRWFGILLN